MSVHGGSISGGRLQLADAWLDDFEINGGCEDINEYFLQRWGNLRCLSVKGMTRRDSDGTIFRAKMREELVQMVRNHQSLGWHCSDLPEGAIAALRSERQDAITFCKQVNKQTSNCKDRIRLS